MSISTDAELSVCARITEIPAELKGGNIDLESVWRRIAVQFSPEAIAIDGQPKEDQDRNRRPNYLKHIVAVTIVGAMTRAPAVLHQVDDKNRLDRNEDH